VTAATSKPSRIGSNSGGVDWEGKDPEWDLSTNIISIDTDFAETIGAPLDQGRGYAPGEPSEESPEFMINETLARLMGKDTVVGSRFSYGGPQGRVIGVIKDFHFDALSARIEPLVLFRGTLDRFSYILVRLDESDLRQGMNVLASTWEKVLPDYPFEYSFLDADFDDMYRAEQRMGGVLRAFAGFAVLIACLGLFGLAAYAAEQRTKEIGIRKILGASVPEVIGLLCREFLLLVGIANLIAAPAGFFIMKKWLDGYAYKTEIGAALFAGVFLLSLGAGLMTVIFQALRAAAADPVKSLRYE
jgi:ABC-type antimicrobial peptide transport system permease subunit